MADLPTISTSNHFNLVFRLEAGLTLLRPSFAVYTSVRILTDFPSDSPFDYSLGPD